MNTISKRLFVHLIVLLTVLSGIVGALYAYGTRAVYISEQCKTVEEAYSRLVNVDIAELCQSENAMKEKALEDEGPILITGSFYLAGELLSVLKDLK